MHARCTAAHMHAPHVVHHALVAAVHVDCAPHEAWGGVEGWQRAGQAIRQSAQQEIRAERKHRQVTKLQQVEQRWQTAYQHVHATLAIPPTHRPPTCAGRLEPHLVLAHGVARAALVALPRCAHGPVGAPQEMQAAAHVAVLGQVACSAGGLQVLS